MKKRELAIAWLQASYSDLMVIEEIMDNDFLSHMVAFHSQQSIEKSFKAILEFYGKKVPKKHDLIVLKELIYQYVPIENEIILEELNELYIDSRYPNSFGLLQHGKPTLEDAKKFYRFSNETFKKICEALDIDKQEIFK